jgi:hypothetical protein
LSVESSAGSLTEEPALHLESDGVIHQADDPALVLPGLSFDVVRALPRLSSASESIDPQQPAAPRTQWEAGGRSGLVGFTTIGRPTDEPVRVVRATHPEEAGRFTATPTSVPGALTGPPQLDSIGNILSLWRAAERLLETFKPGSPERESAIADVTELRGRYQRLFEARLRDA